MNRFVKKYNFTVGTTSYNEEKTIESFIKAVQNQNLPKNLSLSEIIVVASGCTDNTISILKTLQKKDSRIKLYTQKKRLGKVNAVNFLLKKAKSKFIILQSTDTIPDKDCYKNLLNELIKPGVGLTAAKIIPRDDPNTFCGFANHFRWQLHHKINLEYPNRPKVGELIAFRKVFERIPPEALVDEASVEPLIHLQGFKTKYVPKAIIYNRGPKTIREYLSRRRSIHAGHYVTKRKYAYEVITYSGLRIVPIFIRNLKPNPKFITYSLATALLEMFARAMGYFDVKLKLRDQAVWKIAKSTK